MWRLLIVAVTVCAICAVGWLSYAEGKRTGSTLVLRQWAEATVKAQAQAQARELAMQAQIDKIQLEKRNEVARLNRQHAAVVDRLRQRAQRPAVLPEAPAPGDSQRACDGRFLYREDAEFLRGEALRADSIRLQLAACQAAYSAVSE